jgi:hypothetical protein
MRTQLSTQLTDAGHTAVGFAAMAAKQANDSRLDFNARFEPQVRDFRKSAVKTVKTVASARNRVASTVDPLIDRLVERIAERLPETVSENATEYMSEVRKVVNQTAESFEGRVIEVIEFATAIPAKAVRRPVAPVAKSTSAKSTSAKSTSAKSTSAKSTSAKTTSVKSPASKTTAAKSKSAKKVVARATKR